MQSTCFLNQMISELGLKPEDLQKLMQPKAIHNKYRRNIIYDMSKDQIDLFNNICAFPENAQTVKEKQKLLIMFLEKNEKFQDNNYISIWFRLAHEFYLNHKQEIETDFKPASKCQNTKWEMSFAKHIDDPPTDMFNEDPIGALCVQLDFTLDFNST